MKRGRPKSTRITRDDQLGSLLAVAKHMHVSRTWLSGVKRRQAELAKLFAADPAKVPASLVPPAFAGGKTCAQWVKAFILHPINSAFVPTAAYRKVPPSQRQGPAASTSGKSGSPLRQHAR